MIARFTGSGNNGQHLASSSKSGSANRGGRGFCELIVRPVVSVDVTCESDWCLAGVDDNVANVNVEGSTPFTRFSNDPASDDAGSCLLATKSGGI